MTTLQSEQRVMLNTTCHRQTASTGCIRPEAVTPRRQWTMTSPPSIPPTQMMMTYAYVIIAVSFM